MITIGTDFSGVGAAEYAIKRIASKKGFKLKNVFACDMDKYARKSYLANHEMPEDYPENVYNRKIPKESLDLYVSSPPCFSGETLINTSKGFEEIKNIKIGDLVLTHTNEYKKVTATGSKKSSVTILRAQGIIDTKTTSNHKYYVIKRYRKWNNERKCDEILFTNPEWVEAKDLTKDHFIAINIPQKSENPFNISKEISYVLGRYVADGWLRERKNINGKTKGNSVILAIGKDKIESISEKIKIKYTLEETINGVSKLFIYSNSLVSLINNLGLGKGAINKRIPQSIINLPNDILFEFIKGYMDGDGHIHKDHFRATSISKELLMGLQLCIAKIYKSNANIKLVKTPKTKVIQGRVVNQRDYYVLEFRTEMRKQSVAKLIGDKIWYPIREVIHTKQEETVYDITVEEDHSYTANQAIVHNCQSFSVAGKRLGKEDERGILFFNTHEFIQKNKPRFFIIENVKGLLSADNGHTFSEWIAMLGGKTINGIVQFFPHENSVPYHIYWNVLNAKDFNVPQNRERVFIVGIRDDEDNNFSWPKEVHLEKRLKDVLETDVDEKYFLSEKMIDSLLNGGKKEWSKCFKPHTIESEHSDCITSRYQKMGRTDPYIKIIGNTNPSGNGMNGNVFDETGISPTLNTNKGEGIKIGTWRTHKDGQGFRECEDGTCPTITAREREDESSQPVIQVKSATLKGFEEATNGDSINFSNPHSKTRRGRVGKGVAQTLDTSCNQGVCIPVLTPDRAEKRQNGRRFKEDGEEMFTLTAQDKHGVYDGYKIRRLTPTECFRLMDFPDSHVQKCREVGISDSQLYKQAGNSIVVKCLELIMDNLKL